MYWATRPTESCGRFGWRDSGSSGYGVILSISTFLSQIISDSRKAWGRLTSCIIVSCLSSLTPQPFVFRIVLRCRRCVYGRVGHFLLLHKVAVGTHFWLMSWFWGDALLIWMVFSRS